jgi:hypothetical protein
MRRSPVPWRHFRSFFARPSVRDACVVLFLALAAFELVLDFKILSPTALDWIFAFDADTSQYYLAFAYYRNAAWHLPLTDMETMLHPIGASFTLADGIPLLAIPLKAIRWALPADFQYFGVWLFSCVFLSAFFAKLVVSRLVNSAALQWAGTLLIALAPPFVVRFGHCHLAAQWLILAAFWTALDANSLPKWRIWAFSTMSLFVQPYLFVMVSGLLAGNFWFHRGNRRQLLIGGGIWLVLLAVAAWLLGYFGLRESTAPQSARYFADVMTLVSASDTSSVVPNLPMSRPTAWMPKGQAEGYAYLGLGGMLLFVALVSRVISTRVSRAGTTRLHATSVVLALLCLLMAAFAISPSPLVLGQRTEGIPELTALISPITARLRSAGRFIWPLYYYLLVFGMQGVEQWLERIRLKGKDIFAALLLVGAQAADLGPWLFEQGQNVALTRPPPLPRVPRAIEEGVSDKTRYMVFDPPPAREKCPGQPKWKGPYYHLALFGARQGLIVNTDFKASARLADEELTAICVYTERIRAARPLPEDVLLVVPKN